MGRRAGHAHPSDRPAAPLRARAWRDVAIALIGEVAKDLATIVGPAVAETFWADVTTANFVFGEADPRRGVAVFSVHRLRTPDAALFARRAVTEPVHELGHTYGLAHCQRRDCVMWFSNTLSETDRKGTRLCPAHAAEVRQLRRPAY